MNGWVKIHRELLSKPIWRQSTPNHKSILITILLMVDHDGNEWVWKGVKFKTNPGQTVTSINSIKDKSGKGITVQNVRSALLRFESLSFLSQKATKMGRLITVLNWDSYQDTKKEATKKQHRGNIEVTPNKNKRTKEVNNVEFEKFWNEYDKKVGDKGKCCKKFYSLKKTDHINIFNSLQKYKNSTPDKQYRKNPMTYLNNKSWNDEIIQNNVYNLNQHQPGTRIKTDEEMNAK